MKTYKAILIDSEKQEVKEIVISDLKSIYAGISTEKNKVHCVDVVYIDNKQNFIYVDDEGLLKENTVFSFNNGVLAGNGIVSKTDQDGDTTDTDWTAEEVQKFVKWKTNEERPEPQMDFVPFDTPEQMQEILDNLPKNPCMTD